MLNQIVFNLWKEENGDFYQNLFYLYCIFTRKLCGTCNKETENLSGNFATCCKLNKEAGSLK